MIVVDEKLKKLYDDACRKTELDAMLMELREMKASLQNDLAEQAQEVAAEQSDVDALEGFSVKGMLLSLTGKKEAALKKERMEARDAKVQYSITEAELKSVSRKLEQVMAEREQLQDAQEQFWALFPAAYIEYRKTDRCDLETAEDLELQLISAAKKQKEVHEALHTGKEGRASIDLVLKSLKTVREHETDAAAPGTDPVKKQLQLAQQEVNTLRDRLCTFKEELLDLHLPEQIRFDLHGILQIEDDCLINLVGDTEIAAQQQRIAVLLHPAIGQIDTILPYLETTLEQDSLQLHQARIRLAELMFQEVTENKK